MYGKAKQASKETRKAAQERRKHSYKSLMRAFFDMRSKGLLAYQHIGGNSTYAVTKITENAVKDIQADPRNQKRIKGYCYYGKQAAEERNEGLPFYLRYGILRTRDLGTIGTSELLVGELVCRCLKDAGVTYHWSGNPTDCIEVVDW